MNRKKVKIILLCFSFMLFTLAAYSKPKPPKPEEGGAPPPPPGLPIDGGLSLLLVSGVAYGIYTLKRKKE
ncbi:MAG: hypothetical protein Q7U59_09720 [Lutibacter sp.]|jgi:hypothetical protein|nr:hypothetical protein [Lutibacter sp.]MDP3358586.1 hypothetical protein [Lutibacter sp.]